MPVKRFLSQMRYAVAAGAMLVALCSGAWAACAGPSNCATEVSIVNQGAQAAANSPATAGQASTVVQISPNQPQLTTPLDVSINQINGKTINGDPCQLQTPTYTPVSITSATTLGIITGTAAKQTYICSLALVTGVADNVALVEGTGTNCSSISAGMAGGTAAANGFNLAANGGLTFGSGVAAVAATATLADNVCLVTSSAGPLAGVAKWVQQ